VRASKAFWAIVLVFLAGVVHLAAEGRPADRPPPIGRRGPPSSDTGINLTNWSFFRTVVLALAGCGGAPQHGASRFKDQRSIHSVYLVWGRWR